MKQKFRFLIITAAVLGSLGGIVFNAPKAHAGCGFGDITCNPNNWTCPIGGCSRPSRPPESRSGGCPECAGSRINASMSNGTGTVVWSLYIRPTGQSGWGPDQLGDKTLAPSAIWSIGLPSNLGCLWDVRFQYQNGSVRDYPRLNFCTNPGIGLT